MQTRLTILDYSPMFHGIKKGLNPENLNFDLRQLNPEQYSPHIISTDLQKNYL